MGVGLFFQLLICALSLAAYMIAVQPNTFPGLKSTESITGIINVLTATYIYCLLSENVTLDLSSIGSIFYNCDWYRLRPKEQQLLALPIQRGHREYRMTGLGLVECSLRVFMAVSAICLQPLLARACTPISVDGTIMESAKFT